MPEQLRDVVLFIIGAIVVIFGAYYTTYYLGKKSIKTASGREIRLRDRFSVSKDKSFCLVEVKDKVYVVVVTNQSVTLLDTLPASEFVSRDETVSAAGMFPAGGLQKVIAKGISALKAVWARRKVTGLYDLDERITLQMAEEEDNLDIVFREMQTGRGKRKAALSREDSDEKE